MFQIVVDLRLDSGGGGVLPYHVAYRIIHLILPAPAPGQTDVCENITFLATSFPDGN